MRRLPKWIIISLIASLMSPLSISTSASAASATKTVVVKDSTGAPYQNALVRAYWYPEDKDEEKSEILTTNSQGSVSFTYDSAATYGFIIVQPPTSDTTHAIARINNFQTFSAATIEVTLKKADIRVIVKNSDDSDASTGAMFSMTKFFVYTLRSGAFGVSGEDVVSLVSSSFASASPPSNEVGQSSVFRYYTKTKTDTGWSFKFFRDAASTQELPAVSGIHVFKLFGTNVQLNFKNANGSPVSVPNGVNIYVYAERIRPPNAPQNEYFYDWTEAPLAADGSWKGSFRAEGEYRLTFSTQGSLDIPTTLGPAVWVNGAGEVSITSSSTGFAASITTDVTLPAPSIKLEYLDRDGADALLDYSVSIAKKIGASYNYDNTYINNFYSPNGKGAVYLPNGEYKLTINSNNIKRPSTTIYAEITNAGVVLKDVSGTVIQANEGIYRIKTEAAKIKFKYVDNGRTLTYTGAHAINRTTKEYVDLSSDQNGFVYTNLADGTYDFEINQTGNEDPVRALGNYVFVVSQGNITSLKKTSEQTEVVAVDGVFVLGLGDPNVTFQIKIQGNSPVVGTRMWGEFVGHDGQGNAFVKKNSALNSSFVAGGKVAAGDYRVRVRELKSGRLYGPSLPCSVAGGVTVTQCVIDFPAENFKFSVKDQNDQLLSNDYNAYVEMVVSDKLVVQGQSTNPDGETGRISGRLFDGEYRLIVQPNQLNSSVGTKKIYRVSVSSGQVTRVFDVAENKDISAANGEYSLSLQKTNFRGLIKSGTQAVNDSYVNVYTRAPKCCDYQWSVSNSQGKFELFLADGEHDITVNPPYNMSVSTVAATYKVTVLNSNVTSVTDESGSAISADAGIYTLNLQTPNLTGKLSITGNEDPDALEGNIKAFQVAQEGQYLTHVGNGRVDFDGDYALKVPAGRTYLLVYSYQKAANIVTNYCDVVANSATTCNLTIPAENMTFNVFDAGNLNVNSKTWVTAEYQVTGLQNGLHGYLSRPTNQNPFEANLVDGVHKLYLQPQEELQGLYTQSIYLVTVAGGVVTEVKNSRGEVIQAVNGVFSLSFRTPTISGTVVADDGTSPYPNANVNVFNDRFGLGAGSDRQGRFAIQIDEDGIYQIKATPEYMDNQFAQSELNSVTVTNGQGSNNVVLRLRKPNVTGTIRGPTGLASAQNWVNVQKKNESGFYEYIPHLDGRASNLSGLFGFYLNPGTYRFEVNGDKTVGGSRTVSSDCVVVANQNSTCDITLKSSNVKVKVVDGAGTSIEGANGNFYLQTYSPNAGKTWDWIYTDFTGVATTHLDDGTWMLQVYPPQNKGDISQTNFIFTILNGQVTGVQDAQGNSVSAVDGTYSLVLPSVNLTGQITFNNVKINHSATVTLKRKDGDYFYEVNSRWTNNGTFGFRASPGTYRVEVRPHFGNRTDRTTTRSGLCEVPVSGSVTCDVALRAPNFLGKIRTATGDIFRDVSAYLYTEKDSGDAWEYWIEIQDGDIGAYLEDGTYRLNVQPHWQHRALYTEQNYRVVVSGGQITSVTNKLTNQAVQIVDGRYPLTLGAPAITGVILMPGTSTTPVPNVQIVPIDSQGRERWEFSTQSDMDGKFGLTVPDGTWQLWARTWGNGSQFTSAPKISIQVTNGALSPAGELTIRMRAPNLFGKVVKPGTTDPLSEVNINIYMNGEYHYAYTDSSGLFGAHIEGDIPAQCGGGCSIYLSTWRTAEYSSKRYEFTQLGDLGNLAIGGVNATVTVLQPSGATSIPNKWGYVAVEEFDGINFIWQPSTHTNELGKVGLSLTQGKRYKLTAYPNWEREGEFSPKTIEIASFDTSANAQISITFDSPNVYFAVKDRLNNLNSWGWYEVFKLNTLPDPDVYEPFKYGRLDQQGKGAQYLADGTYEIRFWPSFKAVGIVKKINITVANGVVSGSSTINVVLPAGNVSGVVRNGQTPIGGATVAAISSNDPNIIISTVTLADGSYELPLDMSQAWTLKALDPITTAKGELALTAVNGGSSETQVSDKVIQIAITP